MKYKLGIGAGLTLLGLFAIGAIRDNAIAKHDAEVRKAEIAAGVKDKETKPENNTKKKN